MAAPAALPFDVIRTKHDVLGSGGYVLQPETAERRAAAACRNQIYDYWAGGGGLLSRYFVSRRSSAGPPAFRIMKSGFRRIDRVKPAIYRLTASFIFPGSPIFLVSEHAPRVGLARHTNHWRGLRAMVPQHDRAAWDAPHRVAPYIDVRMQTGHDLRPLSAAQASRRAAIRSPNEKDFGRKTRPRPPRTYSPCGRRLP